VVRYQGVGIDHAHVGKILADKLAQNGYKTELETSKITSIVHWKKGFFKKGSVVLSSENDDLIVQGYVEDEIIPFLDEALYETFSDKSKFIPYKEKLNLENIKKKEEEKAQAEQQTQAPQRIKLEKCKNCGAPLNIGGETLPWLIICEYCGFVNNADASKPIPQIGILNASDIDAFKIAEDFIAKGIFVTRGAAKSANMRVVQDNYVPIWHIVVSLNGYVETLRYVTETIGKQVITRQIRQRFQIAETYEVPIIARANSEFQPDFEKYKLPLSSKQPLKYVPNMLSVELDEKEASSIAISKALEHVKKRYSNIVTFNVNGNIVGSPELIYVPIVVVKYNWDKKEYFVAIDKSSGNVIAGTRPLVKFNISSIFKKSEE